MTSSRLVPTSLLRRVSQVLAAPMDDELILLSIEQNRYFGSGEVGRRIWELLEQQVSMSSLLAQLIEEYDVDPDVCARDVEAFLTQLIEARLVVIDE